VWLGLASVAIALVLGTMAAVAIDRFNFPGRREIQMLLISPLVVPQLVVGIAILQFFAMLSIKRGFLLLLIGHVIITSPYVTRSILAALAGFDRSLEEAAMNLGASPLGAFILITLPNISAGILGASIFAFIVSFANLTMSIFIGGPRSTTLPIRLWNYLEFAYDPVITTIGTVILIITVGLLFILSRVASLEKLF
jgi:putative spermidine/putrescine transport system permease protein